MEQAAAQRKERIGDFPTALGRRGLADALVVALADHHIVALIAGRDSHNAVAISGR